MHWKNLSPALKPEIGTDAILLGGKFDVSRA